MYTIENNKILCRFETKQDGYIGWVLPDKARMIEVKANIWEESEIFKASELLYHSSWDWLMPVVEKIGGLHIKHNLEDEISWKRFALFENLYLWVMNGDKANIYQACIEFIKWYNQQSK